MTKDQLDRYEALCAAQRRARISNAPMSSVTKSLRLANDHLESSLRRPVPPAPVSRFTEIAPRIDVRRGR